jgi:CRISPR/Cas system CMR subunit Cmr4 (Cas7 group RAMP superfamily)
MAYNAIKVPLLPHSFKGKIRKYFIADSNDVDADGNAGSAFGIDIYGKKARVSDDISTTGLGMCLDAGNASSY